jgi:hypothetical protein
VDIHALGNLVDGSPFKPLLNQYLIIIFKDFRLAYFGILITSYNIGIFNDFLQKKAVERRWLIVSIRRCCYRCYDKISYGKLKLIEYSFNLS